MLNAQIRRNLQQNQITEPRGLTVRPQVFFSQEELASPAQDPHDVFVPRDPCQDQPATPHFRVSQS